MSVMSPEQCRAGRVWLGLNQQDLADAAKMHVQTVYEYELRRRASSRETVDAMRMSLEAAGVQFMFAPNGAATGIYSGKEEPSDQTRLRSTVFNQNFTREHCRTARAWLDWTQQDLAAQCNVSLSTIRDFENNRLRRGRRYQPMPENLAAMKAAFTNAGIRFLFSSDGRAIGVESERKQQLAA